jgi:succinate dehydrogenase / fumarate reductase membrane anchor subunit
MVTNVTSFGKNGVYDWLLQRLTAVVILAWVLCVATTISTIEDINYSAWRAIFASPFMKYFTLLAVLSLCVHAWIGMWTISTDYLTRQALGAAATFIRLIFQVACAVVLIVYLIWSVQILWSI